jgi:hypothetical protein
MWKNDVFQALKESYNHLTFNQNAKNIHWRKDNFSNQ